MRCQGTIDYIKDFDGETLVTARLQVDKELYNSRNYTEEDKRKFCRVEQKLIFPDDTELVFEKGEVDESGEFFVGGTIKSGVVHYLDITDSSKTVRTEVVLTGVDDYPTHTETVWFGAEVVATRTLPSKRVIRDVLGGFRVPKVFSYGVDDLYTLSDGGITGSRLLCTVDHKCALFPHDMFAAMGHRHHGYAFIGRLARMSPIHSNTAWVCGVPTEQTIYHSANHKDGDVGASINRYYTSAVYLEYKGEYIMAGKVASPIYSSEEWERHFWRSSLDLKEITGIADLDDNILPIGVA
jgi:hypothetical protein